jgi:tetratricopeptide (TPR) repeat protein
MNRKLVNVVFACVTGLLGAVALWSIYSNKDMPVIRETPEPESMAGSKLPEGHPPIDASNKLAALEEMSSKDPQNPDYKTQLGNTYYDLGQYQKAIEAYQASLKLRPQDPSVETDMATCFHILGQHDKALEILDKVLRYRPDFAQALYNKGIVLLNGKNDTKAGIAVWEELLRSNPNYPQRANMEQKIRQLKSGG